MYHSEYIYLQLASLILLKTLALFVRFTPKYCIGLTAILNGILFSIPFYNGLLSEYKKVTDFCMLIFVSINLVILQQRNWVPFVVLKNGTI